MLKIFKNKKVLFGIILLLIGIVVSLYFVINKSNSKKLSDNSESVEINDYIAYLKINPSIKLEYKEKCIVSKNGTKKCDDPTVNKYELINIDAKDIFGSIDILADSNDLSFVINLIVDKAREAGITFTNVEIYSDWSKIDSYIEKNKSQEFEVTFTVNIAGPSSIENKIIADETNKKTFNVTFDTDGGSSVENQIVFENEKITNVKNPTKDGYKFVEWRLNDKTYDFDSIVTKDIVLNAIWKKVDTTTSTTKVENQSDINKETTKQTTTKQTEKVTSTTTADKKFYSIEVDVNDITLEEIKDYVYNKNSYVQINVGNEQGAVCYSSEKSCTLTSPNEIALIKKVNNAILSKFNIKHSSNGLLIIEGDEIGDNTEYNCKEWYASHPELTSPAEVFADNCIKYGDEYYGLGLEQSINLLNPPKTKKDLQKIIDSFADSKGCSGDC